MKIRNCFVISPSLSLFFFLISVTAMFSFTVSSYSHNDIRDPRYSSGLIAEWSDGRKENNGASAISREENRTTKWQFASGTAPFN